MWVVFVSQVCKKGAGGIPRIPGARGGVQLLLIPRFGVRSRICRLVPGSQPLLPHKRIL